MRIKRLNPKGMQAVLGMIYKATYSDEDGSFVDENRIEELFAALGRSDYKTSAPIFDKNCGCVSFYTPVPIDDNDMVVKAEVGEWKLTKVLD
jgi:hypothetical protein